MGGASQVPDPLERGAELDELDLTIAAALASEGRVVVLEGAGGLGKTLLLTLGCSRARALGVTVLRARGGDLERQFPFGVLLQLFEPYLSTATGEERGRIFDGAAAIAEPVLSGPQRPTGSPDHQLLHGLQWVAANIAERTPLLLAIDDAHVADAASLRALHYMAQRIEDLPLAIVLTARPQPTSSGDALSALAAHPLARRLELTALSEQAIAAIVRAQLPAADDDFCAACWRATGGNPFFARELLAALGTSGIEPTSEHADRVGELGPSTVARAIGARLERLSASTSPLAHALAVVGDGARLAHVAALAGLDAGAATTAADELAAADVLSTASGLGFVHPIVRQSVYLGIPAGERARLHLEAARLLHEARGDRAERVAAHLLHALPASEAWVRADLHAGAQSALAGGAPETAAHYLLRALDESPGDDERAALLIDLGRAEALLGRATAIDRLRAAVALLDRPQARAEALAQLGDALYTAGDNAGAASAFDEGLRVLDGADPVLEEQLTAGYLGAARLEFRTREAAGRRFKDLLAGSAEATTPAQRELLAQRALEHAMLGSATQAEVVELIRRAQADGQLLREATADGVAYAGSVAALLFVDALDEVETRTTAGLEDARTRGSVIGFAVMSAVRGASRYLRGDIARALGDLEGGLEQLPLMVLVQPFARGWIALAQIDRGELELAERTIASPDAEADRHFTYNWTLLARGRLALTRGDAQAALEDLLECGRRQAAIPAPSPAVLPWRSEAAIAALALGREEEARTLAAEELRLAREVDSPRAVGLALRAAGLAAGGGAGLELLEQAVRTLGHSPSQLERMRALTDLGGAQRLAGQQALARETLREALDGAYHFGATGLAHRAHAELVASGARPRRLAMRGADALTPSELRVCELALQGLTNRQIAQALFVSTKTVEFHLRNAYTKLRIRSRRELAPALGGIDGEGANESLAQARP